MDFFIPFGVFMAGVGVFFAGLGIMTWGSNTKKK